MRKALLLSGGMDSTCLAYWRRPDLAITIDYGHKAAKGEIRAATAICRHLGIEHLIIRCDLSALGSGDMAGKPADPNAPASEWWPYRNQMLATLAAMECIKHGINVLELGALRTDGFHVDGRREFVEALSALLSMQEGGLRLEAPAAAYSAEELVKASGTPIEILAWSHSCHTNEYSCGYCRGCQKHYVTMEAIGVGPY
ncbi:MULTISPECIES: 7-cyano-7-deazaguanine synthase [Brucella]|uniref:7-cyano-7-deazaguanine synthase n=1 Tax=Brucella lupini TaxID=255457 RepID=A0A256GWU3_9HYPH|nr:MULTISPECIES: 7-cyano-7-deazaguanine synthase [Brucella]RNL43496.1 7-cyano-7-deazaguanine synthase [Ochrobactrum sp. MH181795]KAB2704007.1 7-cyano-7-deazaguanine synthase [Brucella lupini]KAB2728782.1 7-cyano-7-deazaguanine synthase [Brucella anthropi]KAB2745954.1 7-cyano-7-deazaguanine synthase [Brucella anthropi]KAB2800713.1 7-cyano-7-deazaguanine synthase [Brucella anthropi]